jgi:hypothetical protein
MTESDLQLLHDLCEALALELRFSLDEFELHEASESVGVLSRGAERLTTAGRSPPAVVEILLQDYNKYLH